jgi:hypothetical protein
MSEEVTFQILGSNFRAIELTSRNRFGLLSALMFCRFKDKLRLVVEIDEKKIKSKKELIGNLWLGSSAFRWW